MTTRADRFIIVFFLLGAVFALIFLNLAVYSVEPSAIVISVDGREFARYTPDELGEPRQVEVRSEYGYNLVEVSSEGARVLEASCPDKSDVHSGMISKSNQVIICAPNRVSIRIVGGSDDVDGVAY